MLTQKYFGFLSRGFPGKASRASFRLGMCPSNVAVCTGPHVGVYLSQQDIGETPLKKQTNRGKKKTQEFLEEFLKQLLSL